MSTETIIFAGVAVYMLAMLVVGFYASKKTHTITEFVVAGRGLPVWLCSMTVIATWFGGSTMMGGAGAAYDEGMLGVIEDPWGGALALILVGFFFARIFRRLRVMTVADFMEQRYGRVAAMAITASSLFSNIAWVGAVLVAFGLIFESLTSIPLEVGIISGAIVIFVYTAVGGMWAVALTDFIQMLIIILGLIMLLVVILVDVGGWGAVSPHLDEYTFRLFPVDNTPEQWLNYLRAWTIIGVVDVSAQTLFQRVSAAKNERVAQNSFYLGGIGYLIFGLIPVFIGIIASVTMPGLASSESVIPTMAIEHLHPVAVAIFVGALLAAIMSSGDSALLACASLLAKNVLPLVKHDPSPKLSLLVARLAIPACGIIAIFVALKIKVVFNLMVDANILGLAAIIVPFVLGVWWKKANRTGALAAMGVGLSAWIMTLFVAPELPADFIGLAASLVTMLVVTPLTQTFDPPRELRDSDNNPVEMKNRLGVLPLFERT
ncbi:MAG: sodium:solute symporter family protein [Gammaproteobacteria bacterium]|nr:sodium:solute symporter family protein [Gammaproteobacteria bacterium]MDH3372098.1 sodium:solute symporter family protein [Gammaproteobacteria bacterium]MDH3408880.1 sodium:solute symporter family protein [Gammaproteobacteria bacterium]MDH3551023.1 sodium:solute symporter family protein [Gammaproteobacteria bacterium]